MNNNNLKNLNDGHNRINLKNDKKLDETNTMDNDCLECKVSIPNLCKRCKKTKLLRESRKVQRILKEWTILNNQNKNLSWSSLRKHFYSISKGQKIANDVWLIEFDRRNNFGIYDNYLKMKNQKKKCEMTGHASQFSHSPYILRTSNNISGIFPTNQMHKSTQKGKKRGRKKKNYVPSDNDNLSDKSDYLLHSGSEKIQPSFGIPHKENQFSDSFNNQNNEKTNRMYDLKDPAFLKYIRNDSNRNIKELVESYRQSAQYLLLAASEIQRILNK